MKKRRLRISLGSSNRWKSRQAQIIWKFHFQKHQKIHFMIFVILMSKNKQAILSNSHTILLHLLGKKLELKNHNYLKTIIRKFLKIFRTFSLLRVMMSIILKIILTHWRIITYIILFHQILLPIQFILHKIILMSSLIELLRLTFHFSLVVKK